MEIYDINSCCCDVYKLILWPMLSLKWRRHLIFTGCMRSVFVFDNMCKVKWTFCDAEKAAPHIWFHFGLFVLTLSRWPFQILPQTDLWWCLHNQKRTMNPDSCSHPLPYAMPKSDTWPGGIAMESLSNIDSAGSCDSVISMNSGYVSAAVNLLIPVQLPLLPVIWINTTFNDAPVLYWNGELKCVHQVVMMSAQTFTGWVMMRGS